MTHHVTGLIADVAFIRRAAKAQIHGRVAELGCGLGLIPLRREDLASAPFMVHDTDDGDEFQYLTREVIAALKEASLGGTLAYFETEYFGGAGGQGAAAFKDGDLIFGPEWKKIGPINQALKLLGVRLERPFYDEFPDGRVGTIPDDR
jgi:hypothetical protein